MAIFSSIRPKPETKPIMQHHSIFPIVSYSGTMICCRIQGNRAGEIALRLRNKLGLELVFSAFLRPPSPWLLWMIRALPIHLSISFRTLSGVPIRRVNPANLYSAPVQKMGVTSDSRSWQSKQVGHRGTALATGEVDSLQQPTASECWAHKNILLNTHSHWEYIRYRPNTDVLRPTDSNIVFDLERLTISIDSIKVAQRFSTSAGDTSSAGMYTAK